MPPGWRSDDAVQRINAELDRRWKSGLPPHVWIDVGKRFGSIEEMPEADIRAIQARTWDTRLVPSILMPGRRLLHLNGPTGYSFRPVIAGETCHIYQLGGEHEEDAVNGAVVNLRRLMPEPDDVLA